MCVSHVCVCIYVCVSVHEYVCVCVCVCDRVFVVHIQSCSFTDFENKLSSINTHSKKEFSLPPPPPPPKKKKKKKEGKKKRRRKKLGSFAVLKLFVDFSWFITLNLINSE